MLDFTEILNLKKLCDALGIKTELKPKYDGLVLFFPELHCDAAIHGSTYGHEKGLMESYRFPEDGDDVTGNLSAADVMVRLLHL